MHLTLVLSAFFVSTIIILGFWQNSDAQYVSPNSFTWGNYGFSASGVDMYGDTSFYSYIMPPQSLYDYVNSGENSDSYSYAPEYYSQNQYETYTPDFSQSYKTPESPKLIFEERREITCNPKLVSLDEILEETFDAKFSIISQELDGFDMDGLEYNCLVGIRTLDGQNIMGYAEVKFDSIQNAKKNYQQLKKSMDNDYYDSVYEHGNQLTTSKYHDDYDQITEYELKDEYILVTFMKKSDGFYDYFDCPGCVSAVALNRINPEYITLYDVDEGIIRLPACKNAIVQNNDLDFPSGLSQFRTGQYPAKSLLNEKGEQVFDGLTDTCQIDISFPDFVHTSQTLSILDSTFDSELSAQNFYMLVHKTIDEVESDKKILTQENPINNNSFLAEGDYGGVVAVQEQNRVVVFLAKPTQYYVLTLDDFEPLIHKAISRINPQIKSASAESLEEQESPIKPASQKTKMVYSDEIHIDSIVPITQQGTPIDFFVKGKPGFVKVTVTADSQMETLIATSVFDSDLTSLGVGSVKTKLKSGTSYEMLMSVYIPKDASTGNASIFVNTFTDWPVLGGIPQTEEASTIIRIK